MGDRKGVANVYMLRGASPPLASSDVSKLGEVLV